MQFWISTLCNRVDCDLISLSTNTGVNSFAIVNCSIAPLCKKSIVIQFHWGLIKGLGGLPSFYLSSKSKPLNGWTHCLVDQFLCQTLHQISRLIPIAFQCTILCVWIFCTSTNQASGQCQYWYAQVLLVLRDRDTFCRAAPWCLGQSSANNAGAKARTRRVTRFCCGLTLPILST